MTIKISNSLDRDIITNYRMPGKQGDKANPVISVRIQSRALLNDISFPSENFYQEWKKQNKNLFDKSILIEGKTTEKQLIAENSKNIEETNKKAKSKSDKSVDSIQEAADKVNATIEFNEISESEVGKNGTRKK